jgi:transposase-like protein
MGFEVRRRLREPSERKALSRHDVWHPDAVVVSIYGERRCLWRAVPRWPLLIKPRCEEECANKLIDKLTDFR